MFAAALSLLLLASRSFAQTYEAESGVLTGTNIDTAVTGFTGTGYVTGFDASTDSVAITVNVATYGVYALSIRYAAPYGDKKALIQLDGAGAGEVSFPSTATFTNATAGNLLLSAGSHVISILDDWGYYLVDSITLASAPAPPVQSTYEAENGIFSGGVSIDTSTPGYSGTGFVSGFTTSADSVSIVVNAASYAVYDLSVRYLSLYGEKKTSLSINGVPSGEIDLPGATAFASVSAGEVLLNAGSNIIAFTDDWGYYSIDSITITPAPAPAPHHANLQPVDPQATKEARSLLAWLQKKYGKKIISGQQDLQYIQYVTNVTGKTPAIGGFDLIDYSPSRVEFQGNVSHTVEDAIFWDQQGGITTFVWHWNAPANLTNSATEEWWSGFYTAATTWNLTLALEDPTSSDYALLLRDLDAIAVELKRLQKAKIPILWRPLHESVAAGWFWWSAYGPASTIKLYKLMFNRFTKHHNIHNLIWVWSSPEPAFYPGADWVDILGYDSYPSEGDHGPVSSLYNSEISLGKDRKIVTLSEVGSIPDPSLLQVYHADWSYFVVWDGEYINNNAWNPTSFLKEVYHSKYVLTLNELDLFKTCCS